MNILIISVAVLLMIGLLYFEKQDSPAKRLAVKAILSLLFIVAAVIQPHPLASYYHLILIGLIFCLGGDVFLALPQEKMFLSGLVSFLLGHIFYIFAFFAVASIGLWTWIGCAVISVLSGGIYLWLRPHLGTMSGPVIAYMVVISIMVVGACSVLTATKINFAGRLMVFSGAVSFYFSDVFVARDRFLKGEFLNRLIGLPMYYTGQFLLAFSVGFLK